MVMPNRRNNHCSRHRPELPHSQASAPGCRVEPGNETGTDAGFCPYWSAVVGSNHPSVFLTTTQLMLNSSTVFLIRERVSLAKRSNFDHHSTSPRQNPETDCTGIRFRSLRCISCVMLYSLMVNTVDSYFDV